MSLEQTKNSHPLFFGFKPEICPDLDISKLEQHLSEESRDFGIDKCVDAVKEIFSPELLRDWDSLDIRTKESLIKNYADEVAKAFELKNYDGVYFETMQPFLLGYNNGDGSIHLNDSYLTNNMISPLELIDTITHELRHQYQSEAVMGFHNIPEDVKKEWLVGFEEYTTSSPYVYDPWGYIYNPLEIDANYAGSTVIREITKDLINSDWA